MPRSLPEPPPASGAARSVLEGVLERVTFTNEENGWSVVRLSVPGRADLVTAVGNLPGVQPGESLRLTGSWVNDRSWGEQFKVDAFTTVKPSTVVGIEKYLGSGMVKGIGKVMARRLVERFGVETLEVIDLTPQRLEEVDGIGPVRRGRIQGAWAEQRAIRQVMVFLQSNGVSPAYAVKIHRQYREAAIQIVQENPYRLARDIFGIGFKTADRIARNLGIPADSPRRAEAGVLHVLAEGSDEGHVFMPRDRLRQTAREVLEIDEPIIDQAITAMAAAEELVVDAPVASEESPVYLKSLHIAESGTASLLRALVAQPLSPIEIDVEKAITWFEQRQGIELAPEQREAIRLAVRSKALVITGGPGTGKTTLVNGIIRILEKKGRRILLAAPTGRAAKRMTETTGREARTIHRLLEFNPKRMAFDRNRENPLEADLVILDESSMIDTVLGFDVLKALPPACQLILVGDVDQLPSVGPGSVLADLIESGAVPVARLRHIFRQASQSQIVVNAHRINEGLMPFTEGGERADFFFLTEEQPEAILATVKGLVAERLPRKYGFNPVEDIQVLTPMRRGSLGAASLNSELQALLNPHGKAITRGSRLLRVGDKVMQLRNNYDLDVYNGDVGRVADIDEEEQLLAVEAEGRRVEHDFADLDELALSYACTVHKSQGSEYPCVVMPLHTQHFPMLQRNLLYTAITRGKKLVVLVGSRRALAIAVKNADTRERNTLLAERLRA
jgi:exodeoxyribonuclease V alpha subunit